MKQSKHAAAGTAAGSVALPAPVRSPGRAVARLARHLETSLAPFDLSVAQYRVLALLAGGAAASSALADRLAVSPPSITAVVDGLVARDLVTRTPDPSDRRRLTLELTAAAHRLLGDADGAVTDRLASVAAFVDAEDPGDPDEAGVLVASLERWNGALDAFREEARRARAQPSAR